MYTSNNSTMSSCMEIKNLIAVNAFWCIECEHHMCAECNSTVHDEKHNRILLTLGTETVETNVAIQDCINFCNESSEYTKTHILGAIKKLFNYEEFSCSHCANPNHMSHHVLKDVAKLLHVGTHNNTVTRKMCVAVAIADTSSV